MDIMCTTIQKFSTVHPSSNLTQILKEFEAWIVLSPVYSMDRGQDFFTPCEHHHLSY